MTTNHVLKPRVGGRPLCDGPPCLVLVLCCGWGVALWPVALPDACMCVSMCVSAFARVAPRSENDCKNRWHTINRKYPKAKVGKSSSGSGGGGGGSSGAASTPSPSASAGKAHSGKHTRCVCTCPCPCLTPSGMPAYLRSISLACQAALYAMGTRLPYAALICATATPPTPVSYSLPASHLLYRWPIRCACRGLLQRHPAPPCPAWQPEAQAPPRVGGRVPKGCPARAPGDRPCLPPRLHWRPAPEARGWWWGGRWRHAHAHALLAGARILGHE